jgi:hypothetical protein
VNISTDPAQQSQPAQGITALPTILACDLSCKMNKTCLEWKHLRGRLCYATSDDNDNQQRKFTIEHGQTPVLTI